MEVSVEIYRAAIGFLVVTSKQTFVLHHVFVIVVFLILLFFGQSRTCLFIYSANLIQYLCKYSVKKSNIVTDRKNVQGKRREKTYKPKLQHLD